MTGQRRKAALCAAMRRGPPRSGNTFPPVGGSPTSPPRRGGPDRAGPRGQSRSGPAPAGGVWLHGLHPVVAALANPARRLKRLLLTEDAEAALAARLPKPWRISPERVERAQIASCLPEDSVHQGAALLAEPLPDMPLDRALEHGTGPVLVL